MRFILDANALIYLIKANLTETFIDLLDDSELVIDSHVYNEVVEVGIENKYPDAYNAKNFIEKHRIPIIHLDIKSFLSIFRDPGETSCFMLGKQEGVCICSDVRANKKFRSNNVAFSELDMFFFNQFRNKKINRTKFLMILNELRKVNGTSANRISVFLELISEESEISE